MSKIQTTRAEVVRTELVEYLQRCLGDVEPHHIIRAARLIDIRDTIGDMADDNKVLLGLCTLDTFSFGDRCAEVVRSAGLDPAKGVDRDTAELCLAVCEDSRGDWKRFMFPMVLARVEELRAAPRRGSRIGSLRPRRQQS